MRRLALAGVAALTTVVVEVAVLIGVASWIGFGWTLLLVLASSVLGGWLLRREGRRGWRRFRDAAAEGRTPGREATDGLIGLIAGLLLAVPGFVTDLTGAVLLVPPVRALARSQLERGAERFISPGAAGDLFGPRRVKVRRGRPAPTKSAPTNPPYPPTQPAEQTPPHQPRPVLEGEIIDVRGPTP